MPFDVYTWTDHTWDDDYLNFLDRMAKPPAKIRRRVVWTPEQHTIQNFPWITHTGAILTFLEMGPSTRRKDFLKNSWKEKKVVAAINRTLPKIKKQFSKKEFYHT